MIDKNSDPHLRLSEAATYWSSFVGEHYLHLPLFAKLRQTIEAGLLQRNLPERGKMPVPAIDPASITPQQFRRGYIKRYAPIVLKGLAAEWPAVRKWSPEFFQANYGAENLCVRAKAVGVGQESVYTKDITLAELVEDMRHGGEYYGTNLEDLFNHNPELREDLLIPELETFSCARPLGLSPSQRKGGRYPRWGEIFSTQIFITRRGRTGYHCAAGGNFFVQVYGRKRWVFVNPRHTPFMYPVIRKDFFYSGSTVDDRMGRDELFQAGHGLYNFIPKYEVVLDPGDVLYSPQWWWHTVDNLGPSIGVSMRFLSAPFASNPVYSTMSMFSPNVVRHFFQIIRTGWGVDRTGARTLFEPEPSQAKAAANRPAGKTEAAGRL